MHGAQLGSLFSSDSNTQAQEPREGWEDWLYITCVMKLPISTAHEGEIEET